MLRHEMFDGTKTYMYPNGEVATPERIRKDFPAVDVFPHVLEINGNVVGAVMELEATKGFAEQSDDETVFEETDTIEVVLEKLNIHRNKKTQPQVQAPTPEERMAAAMEFQNLMSL